MQLRIAKLKYAKIHMVWFYCDFMDNVIDRRYFEYIEVETGSTYMYFVSIDNVN